MSHPDDHGAPAAGPRTLGSPLLTLQRALPIIDAAGKVGIPVLVSGGSGIGKTEGLTTLATARGEHLEIVTASLYEPTDFGGLPVIDNGQVNLAPMPWIRRAIAAGKPVRVLFDELNTAPHATQAAMLRLLLEGVAGDTPLPENTTFVAAINPVEASTGGWELPAPIAARFLHLHVGVDADDWIAGMLTGWDTTPTRITCLDPDDQRAAAALAQVTAFIAANPEHLVAQPTDPTLAAGAWSSPRKWDWVTRILPLIPDEDDLLIRAVEGLVGRAAATAFLTWADTLDLPAAADVLTDPTGIDWATEPAERVQAILLAVVAASHNDVGSYEAAGHVLQAVVDADRRDVAATAIKPYLTAAPAGAPRNAKLLAAFAPLLARAGKVG